MIADRTYHRLLHVAWIRADVDGDGVPEYVPANDRPGASRPGTCVRAVLDRTARVAADKKQTGFYVGGNIYSDWAKVPDSYKVEDPRWPDPSRSTASIFRFTW